MSRDFLFLDDDPFAETDFPITCPPDCDTEKNFITADPNIGAVHSCTAHRPKNINELRAAVERAR